MRHIPRQALAGALIVGVAAPSAAAAPSPVPSCPALFDHAPMVLALQAMPVLVVSALNAKFQGGATVSEEELIAARDADWQSTDVILPGPPLPGRRFIGGGRRGNTWFVWYERGGIAHTYVAAVFEVREGASAPTRITHRQTTVDNLCGATLWLLDARAPPAPDGRDW